MENVQKFTDQEMFVFLTDIAKEYFKPYGNENNIRVFTTPLKDFFVAELYKYNGFEDLNETIKTLGINRYLLECLMRKFCKKKKTGFFASRIRNIVRIYHKILSC